MADAAPTEGLRDLEPRVSWYGGLSARLLLLTVLIVVFASILILPPNLAAFEEGWLLDRLRAAELATLVEETAPGGVVTDQARNKLLASAGVVSVALQVGGERRLILAAPRLKRTPYLVDLRGGPLGWFTPWRTLVGGGDRYIRVMAKPRFRPGAFVEVVAPDAPLRRELITDLWRLMGIAAFTSLVAGAVVYLALSLFLVRPVLRLTRAMERFRADPQSVPAPARPSGRRDEIGLAERELALMQLDVRAALASRARLAALGEAVAKINHDLRNMLTSAQLASQRLSRSGDPSVTQALPRLERALDRAVTLASNVLAFGSSAEPQPTKRAVSLRPAVEAAAEDAGLRADGVPLVNEAPAGVDVHADPEQLHRILLNLLKNAREAIEGMENRGERGRVTVSSRPGEGGVIVRVADDGPGLPEKARANLFQPFAGSTRREGTGLGLAIAKELVQGHGGDLALVSTSPAGRRLRSAVPEPLAAALGHALAPGIGSAFQAAVAPDHAVKP